MWSRKLGGQIRLEKAHFAEARNAEYLRSLPLPRASCCCSYHAMVETPALSTARPGHRHTLASAGTVTTNSGPVLRIRREIG